MDIGKRIVKLRENKGWSQKELARRVNLNASVMNRIESGERPIKDLELIKISEVLGVKTDYLLGLTEKSNDSNELTPKDEIDIAKRMAKIREDLQNADGGLSFHGEPMSEEAMESVLEALEFAERTATKINKKYIPKKYREENE